MSSDPSAVVTELEQQLLTMRRELHAHPELSWKELQTTQRIARWLRQAGLEPQLLPTTTGLYVDVGAGPHVAGFRGDIDALPITEFTGLEYASVNDGVAHSCGHDIHTTVMLGLALSLHRLHAETEGGLGGTVRVIFQPAEETMPGGALEVISQKVVEPLPRVFALHCEPRIDVGSIGTRIGAITSAADVVRIEVSGRGGHTSRPHLTEDVVGALAHIAATAPNVLARRIDVRSAVSLVWGQIHAGSAHNAIPSSGTLTGTMRILDAEDWWRAGDVLDEIITQCAAPFGVDVDVEHVRGVPPVNNAEAEISVVESAARKVLGDGAVLLAPQSMGGEDFAWMTHERPGAMFRLGTRAPGGEDYDLHRGDYIPDERAIGVGVRVMLGTALTLLGQS
ncbi:amidohydrolase [Nesterenkonia aerolata]|uniref:Amidohydrolase n=1 Tax=Nesterenkonia aerolata TaxID=3074079 RepID=A0ABU2DQN2_9MICC|nr:amidohydrolase [Nesterenkonia sp. LY-0111]MDR8018815.1 amidohydrolase [Nesterenkonia sp. LY-0111]